MTDPTRGARLRRGTRRPGWILMTALLVLAIAASSALVFTSRAELLKLAVLLALWAAVVAAFASVIYRRQSDSDQAKVRDLKLVYDLQLDREISARREYELAVEAQLRRELTAELRAQSADEVAGLRAELAALRANLEYLFDADLSHRHAIETDRASARGYGDWTPAADIAGRVRASRIDTEDADDAFDGAAHNGDTEESPIIDVPAEPHPPEPGPATPVPGGAHRRSAQVAADYRPRAEGKARRREAPPPPPPPPRTPPPPEPLYPWLPPPAPTHTPEPSVPGGTHWQSQWVAPSDGDPGHEYVGRRRAREDAPRQSFAPPDPQRGRHYASPAAPPAAPTQAPPAAESAGSPDSDGGAHTGGQSVAELMARLQATPSGGGRRRRRED